MDNFDFPSDRSTSPGRQPTRHRPAYDPKRLVADTFWMKKPTERFEPAVTSPKHVARPPAQTPSAPTDRPKVSLDFGPRTSATFTASGFVQERPEEKVIFPPQESRLAGLKETAADSDHNPTNSSAPALRSADMLPIKPDSYYSELELITKLRNLGIQMVSDDEDDENVESDQNRSIQTTKVADKKENCRPNDTRLQNPPTTEPGIFLFSIDFDSKSWDIYDYHEPSMMASQIILELGITDPRTKNSIRTQILARYVRRMNTVKKAAARRSLR